MSDSKASKAGGAASSPAATKTALEDGDAKVRDVPALPTRHDETETSSENHTEGEQRAVPVVPDDKHEASTMTNDNAANNSHFSLQPDTVALLNNLDSNQRREYLKHQVEFYFSRENLAQDAFLVSQMDSDQYVAVELIASFNNVRRLVDDLPTLLDVIRESKQLQLDSTGTRVRPMFQRSIVVMREVARDVTEEQVSELFNGTTAKAKNCPSCTSVEYADNGCWYVAFDTQNEAQRALDYVRAMKTFRGQPIMARLKAVPLARGALAFNRQFLASATPQQGSLYQGSPNRISPMSGNSSIDISPLHFATHVPATAGNIISKSDSFLPDSLLGEQQQQQHQAGTLPVRIMPTPTIPLVSTSAPPPSVHLPLLAPSHQQQRQSVDITSNDGVNSENNTKSRRKAGVHAGAPFVAGGGYGPASGQQPAGALPQEFLAAMVAGQAFHAAGDDGSAAAAGEYYQHYQQQQQQQQWMPGFEHYQHHSLRLGSNAPPSGSTQSSPLNSNGADSNSESFSQYNVGGEWNGGSNSRSTRRWQQHQQRPNVASHGVSTPDDPSDVGFVVPDVNYAGDDSAAAFIHHQYMSGNVPFETPLLTLVAAAAAANAEYPVSSSSSQTTTGRQRDVRQQQQKCDVVFSSPHDNNNGNVRVSSDASYFQQHQSSPYAAAYYPPQHNFGAASESMLLAAGYSPSGSIVYHQQSGGSPQQQQHHWNIHDQQSSNKRYASAGPAANRSPTNHEMSQQQQQQHAHMRFNDSNDNSAISSLNPGATQLLQPFSTSSLPASVSNRRRSSYRNTATNTMQHDSSTTAAQSSTVSRFNNNNSSLPVSNRFTHHSGAGGNATACGVVNCNHRSCNNNRLPSPMRDAAGDGYAAQYNFYGQHAPYKIVPKTDAVDANSSFRSTDNSNKRDAATGSDYSINAPYGGGQEYGYQYNKHNKFPQNNHDYKTKDGFVTGQHQPYSSASGGGTDSAVSSLSSSNSTQPPPLSDSSGYASVRLLERTGRVADIDQRNRAEPLQRDNGPVDRNNNIGVGRGRPVNEGLMMPNRRPYDSKEFSGYNDNSQQHAANRYQGASAKSGSCSDNKRNSTHEGEARTLPTTTSGAAAPYVRLSPSSSNNISSKPPPSLPSSSSVIQQQHQGSGRKPPITASPRATAYSQKMQHSRGGNDAADHRQPSFELAGTAFPPLPTPDVSKMPQEISAFKSGAQQQTTETASAADVSSTTTATQATETLSASGTSEASHHNLATNAWLQPKPDLRFHPPTAAHHSFAEPHHYTHQRQQQHAASSTSSIPTNGSNTSSSCWNSSSSQQNNNNRHATPFIPPQQRKPIVNKVDKCIGTQDMSFMPRDMYTQLVKLVKMFKTNGTTNVASDIELTEQQQRQNDEMHRLLEELTLGGNVVLANEVKRRLTELNTVQKLNALALQQQQPGGLDKKGDNMKSVAAQTDKCSAAKNHVTSVLRQQSFTEKGTLTEVDVGMGDADAGASGDATSVVTVNAC